jgi:hypothetical protein
MESSSQKLPFAEYSNIIWERVNNLHRKQTKKFWVNWNGRGQIVDYRGWGKGFTYFNALDCVLSHRVAGKIPENVTDNSCEQLDTYRIFILPNKLCQFSFRKICH